MFWDTDTKKLEKYLSWYWRKFQYRRDYGNVKYHYDGAYVYNGELAFRVSNIGKVELYAMGRVFPAKILEELKKHIKWWRC
jgi:hypothetical protein